MTYKWSLVFGILKMGMSREFQYEVLSGYSVRYNPRCYPLSMLSYYSIHYFPR